MNERIAGFRKIENSGLSLISHKDMKNIQKEKESKEKQLKLLRRRADWAVKRRSDLKNTIQNLSKQNPEVEKALKMVNRGVTGNN